MIVLSGAIVVLALVVVVTLPDGPSRPSGRALASGPTAAGAHHPSPSTTRDPTAVLPLAPTAASPLRVVEIGDSLGIDLGDQLQSQLDATPLARTTMASVGDSGLANVRYYDWPAHLVTLLAVDHPQVVVVFIGANDDQGLYFDGAPAAPGSRAWVVGYAQRVDDVAREVTSAGARLVWVGMPPMQSPSLDAAMQREDVVFERETAAFPGALYVASSPVLGTSSGLYETTGDDASGHPVALRTPDGVHLTPAGAALLARSVIDHVDGRWHLSLGVPAAAPTTTG